MNPLNLLACGSRNDYSLAGEALIIAALLPKTGPRLLVDVDAGDGVTWSISRSLLDDGWSALLLEGDSLQFEALKQNLSKKPQAKCLNLFCGKREKPGEMRKLSSVLVEHGVSRDFQLLVLNNSVASPVDVLDGLDAHQHQPGIIAMKDPEDEPSRSHRYRKLITYGYLYSGMAGTYSIWSVVPLNNRTYAPESLGHLPPFAEACLGTAAFDPVPSALGNGGPVGEQTYLISGWAFVEPARTVPPVVYLELREHRTGVTNYFPAYRCNRPDVGERFNQPFLAASGFRALISVMHRAAGLLSVRVLQVDSEHSYRSTAEVVIERRLEEYELTPRGDLARKFLAGTGIEIGALRSPVPLPTGSTARYVDRMTVDELLEHYPHLKGWSVQAPDIIDDGERLSSIADQSQNFVIANHFLEHCRNPLETLLNFLRVLRSGGILFMAVPDQRFTFDCDRPCTNYEVLQETYQTGRRPDSEELFQEWVRCVERRSGEEVERRASELRAMDYSIHYNVWTLDDLLLHLLRARNENAFPFRILTVVCCDNEAILLIEKVGPQGARETLLKRNENHLREEPAARSIINSLKTEVIPETPMPETITSISNIVASDATQTNAKYSLWKYVIPLPPDSLMWSVGGGSIENFLVVGDAWAQVVSRYTQENTTLLDIGSGCGRTARVLVNNPWIKKYVGFDVIRENVEWCQRFIVPNWRGTAEFHWMDIYSGEYNPQGPLKAQDVRFPCNDGEADIVFAASVFTHLLELDAIHYLGEVGRSLSARGYAILSIHNNVSPGQRFCGTETRIDIDPGYFLELASAAGLKEIDRIDDLGGQQAFVLKRK